MRSIRNFTLFVALIAISVGAYMLGRNSEAPSQSVAQPQVIYKEGPKEPMTEILITAKAMNAGDRVGDTDLQWASWPEAHRPPNSITRMERATAIQDFKGVLARSAVSKGETVTPDRFILDPSKSFMSAVLAEGMRAVAIPANPVDTAGGFILPGDRVDILNIVTGPNGRSSQPLLTNVKILAIGSEIQEQPGQRTMMGSTATIEVTPEQAELIALAQKSGTLTMTLRPFSKDDGTGPQTAQQDSPLKNDAKKTLRIVRSGVSTEIAR